MNANVHRQLNRRKRRILRRIENKPGVERPEPIRHGTQAVACHLYDAAAKETAA